MKIIEVFPGVYRTTRYNHYLLAHGYVIFRFDKNERRIKKIRFVQFGDYGNLVSIIKTVLKKVQLTKIQEREFSTWIFKSRINHCKELSDDCHCDIVSFNSIDYERKLFGWDHSEKDLS